MTERKKWFKKNMRKKIDVYFEILCLHELINFNLTITRERDVAKNKCRARSSLA